MEADKASVLREKVEKALHSSCAHHVPDSLPLLLSHQALSHLGPSLTLLPPSGMGSPLLFSGLPPSLPLGLRLNDTSPESMRVTGL